MTPTRIGCLLVCVLAVAAAPARADQAAEVRALVNKADMAYRGHTAAAIVDMQIVTRSYKRHYKMVMWDDSARDRTLVKILGPALWRGYGTLKVGGGLKLYDPKTNHVTVVGHSMLGDSWMGSHLSNDDLVKETELARDYHIALVGTRKGVAGGSAVTFYTLRLTPKPTAPVVWGRIRYQLWARDSEVVPVEAAYYRKAGDAHPTRTITFSALRTLGGRLLPSVMTVTVADKPGEYTRLIYDKLRFNVRIPDSKFTDQALRR